MKWKSVKEFLKPDWKKIVVFIALFILLMPIFIFFEHPFGLGSLPQYGGGYPGFPFHYRFIFIGGESGGKLIETGETFVWIYFILDVLMCGTVSYLISCLIFWKEFLRPGWRKIGLTILLIFPHMAISSIILLITLPLLGVSSYLSNYVVDTFFPISFILCYLLSCLMLWAYDKLKSRKKWKSVVQFLKPTKRKIILAITLPYAILFSGPLLSKFSYSAGWGIVLPAIKHPLGYLFLIFLVVVQTTLYFIWSYPLSCLVVWLYDKLKPRKK